MCGLTVGIDFDNTLVNYDRIFLKMARQLGVVLKDKQGKKNIRDAIRQLPDGEIKWQQVQAHVYGHAMDQALLMEGAAEFVLECRRRKVPVYIVSHKTRFAAQDNGRTDLRQAALSWMGAQGFFGPGGLGFSRTQVFFESTRQEKIDRIKQLNCTHFIDDLEETFQELSFPPGIKKILYSSQEHVSCGAPIKVIAHWKGIHAYIFDDRK